NEANPSEDISYGKATVSVPWGPQDISWTFNARFERQANSTTLEGLTAEDFFNSIYTTSQQSPKHDAFVFVHGFHTPFSEALSKTGKLAFDLKFQGAGILYSWPSGNDITSYDHEYENADWSVKHLTGMLLTLAGSHT